MNAKESYLIEVYYENNEGRIRRHQERVNIKDLAKQLAKLYSKRIGQIVEISDFSGKIMHVITYKMTECTLND